MIHIEKNDKIDIISFTVNKINALIVDEIRERILKILDNSNSKVIIDLKGVDYIDSSGFGCFLSVISSYRSLSESEVTICNIDYYCIFLRNSAPYYVF